MAAKGTSMFRAIWNFVTRRSLIKKIEQQAEQLAKYRNRNENLKVDYARELRQRLWWERLHAAVMEATEKGLSLYTVEGWVRSGQGGMDMDFYNHPVAADSKEEALGKVLDPYDDKSHICVKHIPEYLPHKGKQLVV